ncbi:hypothetical protein Fmac_002152 [Flemingia macrophylla]|uniref:Peptidase A1 domain-containing protein n=1 Tax=Flemingia macrophylla TaxID=520843 RepID=A0ABD1NKG1_9FABA
MGHFRPSPLFLLCFILCLMLCISESHRMIILPLTHSISNTQFNATHHLLKSTSTRSAARFHEHRRNPISLPLSSGSDYTLSLTIGSERITVYMDTGSDVVWVPCTPFECILCEGKSKALNMTLTHSHSVSCESPACGAAHASMQPHDLCAVARCPLDRIETSDCSDVACPPFYYAYADGSFVAKLHRHSLSISSLSLKNFTFACAHTALAEPIGVAGFGRGLLSLPAQLSTLSPNLGNTFSYCLISHSFQRLHTPSPLILGRHAHRGHFVYTSMLPNPNHPYFYCVGLSGISVGERNIPAPEMLRRVDRRGGGGVVVDSGTTFTMLPASLYEAVVGEFGRRVGRVAKRASEVEERTGLGPCFFLKGPVEVPAVTLHFVGNDSSVVLPRRNYFYEFLYGGDGVWRKRKVGCMMVMNGGDEADLSPGPGAVLGNYQQQGFEVVYDLEKRRVGFAKKQCASLWDTLNRLKI